MKNIIRPQTACRALCKVGDSAFLLHSVGRAQLTILLRCIKFSILFQSKCILKIWGMDSGPETTIFLQKNTEISD